jgi:hypothetical protein
MPQAADHPWTAGMVMPVHVAVTVRAQVPITHNPQDARKTGLQHIENNHPNATAKHSQIPSPGERAKAGNPIPRIFQALS